MLICCGDGTGNWDYSVVELILFYFCSEGLAIGTTQ